MQTGITPIYFAAKNNYLRLVELLLAHGADINKVQRALYNHNNIICGIYNYPMRACAARGKAIVVCCCQHIAAHAYAYQSHLHVLSAHAHNLGKGHQQSTCIIVLQDALQDATHGVCALESSSLKMYTCMQ